METKSGIFPKKALEQLSKSQMQDTTAEEVIELLGLTPVPIEGGYYRETYRDALSSSIFYLITSESYSCLHRLSCTGFWNFYAGDPAKMIQISPEGVLKQITLGANLHDGQTPQAIVPAGHYQGTRLSQRGSWALFGCSTTPPFEKSFFSHAQRSEIIKQFPSLFDIISRYSYR